MATKGADFRYLVEDSGAHDGSIFTEVFKTEQEAQDYASYMTRLPDTAIKILYVEKTEAYYLPSDLADAGFNWGGFHSADEIELKETESHYV